MTVADLPFSNPDAYMDETTALVRLTAAQPLAYHPAYHPKEGTMRQIAGHCAQIT
ncbi:hypothetical protein ACH4GK_25720 [Streptomyces rimosus]|uniref:hypothetical protein n=1 Tax=Streptomyces rimosus TaxID=1927 RepID=UPI00131C9B73|nr:hypothetical protein [Streptomyces rimosus]